MKDGQVIKTAVSVLFKTSSRANAKLRMKTFRNKNIDDILDPDKRLLGIPAGAEIVKIAMGKKSIQDFKDILNPPEEIQKPVKPKKFSPPKKPAKAPSSAKASTRKIIKAKTVAKPKIK